MPGKTINKKDDKVDHVFGKRYRALKKLGSGNYGTAYLVKDEDPKAEEEHKVLKAINIGFVDADETVDAVKEADLLKKLDHPFVVKFYDSFLDGANFCIVTEFCESGDLDQFISRTKKEGRQLDEDRVLRWVTQLLLGVHYIHSRRILHRDLKSRNIFIKQGKLKIGDFGISRVMYETSDLASSFIGTPYYMSPEVLKHVGYNSKSDVWSIGCILYELCALKHAFEGQGLMGVMYKIVEQECPRLPQQYSQALQEMFQKILTKEPSERPSAGQLLQLSVLQKHIQALQESDATAVTVSMTIGKREATMIQDMFQRSTHRKDLNPESVGSKKIAENREQDKEEVFLSPIERMRRRKQEEADKRAKEMSEAAKQSGTLHEIAKLRKEKTNLSSEMLPFSRGTPRPTCEPERERTLLMRMRQSDYANQGGGPTGTAVDSTDSPFPEMKCDDEVPHTLTKTSSITSSGARWREQIYLEDGNDHDEGDSKAQPTILRTAELHKPQPLKGSSHNNLYNASKGRVNIDQDRGFPAVAKRLPSVNYPSHTGSIYENALPPIENDENIVADISVEPSIEVGQESVNTRLDQSSLQRPLSAAKRPPVKENLLKVLQETADVVCIRDDATKKPFDMEAKIQKIVNMKEKCRSSMGSKSFDTLYKRATELTSRGIPSSELYKHLDAKDYNKNHLFLLEQLIFLEAHSP